MECPGNPRAFSFFALPPFLVMACVVFFFRLGSLFDERKDRSVLF